ncbi:glycosyltransferase family 4 protein [Balneolaceae bacterium YR4-1]|uniref:Glycosyltransferase family 4 protein n=1 Tax=Halalkalibaculum roseum TaxID=2709311 RepID=A0A6M1T1P8_9BACT|nr:glycosyltransferase [Halalkalibaculum roseum]NGP76677.1 glycosyltransferase family 4 protein [Halalkalibaculum roseum]
MNKVCLVIHSLGIGGMERVMSQLADNFSSREKTIVDLILIGRKREIAYSLSSSIKIHRPPFQFDDNWRTIDTLRTIWFLRQKVKEIAPDTVLSFGEYWNNLVLLSLLGLSYPLFISDRSEPGKDLGKFQNFLRNSLYPKAAGYIAQTTHAKKACISNGWNSNIKVIGNPIMDIQPKSKVEKDNIVLSVGRLIKTKHFDQLIKMFVKLDIPGWKLVIVGGDAKKLSLSEDLKNLVNELGAESSVFLEGEQKEIDVYYQKSKIFAFTSSSEGFPNVIGEALSAGLPVVSYDCVAGPSDLIEDGENGYLVPLFDQETFKQKLKLLMEYEELRNIMGLKSAKYIKVYSKKNVADQFYKFITGCA